jgi:hypothetical protein
MQDNETYLLVALQKSVRYSSSERVNVLEGKCGTGLRRLSFCRFVEYKVVAAKRQCLRRRADGESTECRFLHRTYNFSLVTISSLKVHERIEADM